MVEMNTILELLIKKERACKNSTTLSTLDLRLQNYTKGLFKRQMAQ